MSTNDSPISKFRDTLSCDELLTLCRITAASERYEDMCLFTTALVKQRKSLGGVISIEERNLLAVAFKNVIGNKRISLRTLCAEMEDTENEEERETMKEYRCILEEELKSDCLGILGLIEDHLMNEMEDEDDESKIFYFKMCGDYYRYLAEMKGEQQHHDKEDDDDERKENENEDDQMDCDGNGDENGFKESAERMYGEALKVVESTHSVPPTHPTVLGLALNFSICCYRILNDPQRACDLAKDAFDAAISDLGSLRDDPGYRDSTLILQILRDNLNLWTMQSTD